MPAQPGQPLLSRYAQIAMQVSARKIKANQRNAQSSTGPKTPAGKQRSSHNATRHGLSSVFVVLPHEDQAEFDQLLEAYRQEFTPKTTHESFLNAQIAESRWRLNRTRRFEALALEQLLSGVDETNPDAIIVAKLTEKCSDVLALLNRYAVAAERSYYRAHRELTQARSRDVRNKANEAKLWLKQQLERTTRMPDPPPFDLGSAHPGHEGTGSRFNLEL